MKLAEQVDSTSNNNSNFPVDSKAGDWSTADINGPKTKSQHSDVTFGSVQVNLLAWSCGGPCPKASEHDWVPLTT